MAIRNVALTDQQRCYCPFCSNAQPPFPCWSWKSNSTTWVLRKCWKMRGQFSLCSHTVERDQRAKRYGLNHRMAFFFFFPLINYSYVPKGGVGNLLSGFRTENVASNSGKDGLKIHLYKHSLLFSTKPFVINQVQSFDIPSQSVVCSKSYVVENREGDI